jgi:glycerol-3-phosphate O-acyltransferase
VSATIELPVWLVGILVALALVAVLDRLLIPSARFFLHRRLNQAIAELNSRLRLRIQPFKLTRRQSLVDRLMFDQELVRAAEAHCAATGEPRAVAMARIDAYAREIVPNFSAYAYFRFGTRAARLLSTVLYRVRLGYFDEAALGAVDPNAAVVFVINHRSNMDYVLVTYMVASSSALSYAVGEWARVWLLEALIRAMGAYFIRRDSRDPLYRKVLARYVQLATAEGVTQAMFPEGGLSRDGALRPPKFGLLSYMVARFDPDGERDVVFVPVGINYDRVLEDRNLTASLAKQAGTPYAQLKTTAFLRYVVRALGRAAIGRWYRNGYAAVSFGTPVLLRAYARRRNVDFRKLNEARRFIEVETLGNMLMGQVAKIIPVLPVSLIATVLLRADQHALTEIEIKSGVLSLIEEIREKGAHVHVPRGDVGYAVHVGLRMLTMRGIVEVQEDKYLGNPNEMVLLRYYANGIAHHLTSPPCTGDGP